MTPAEAYRILSAPENRVALCNHAWPAHVFIFMCEGGMPGGGESWLVPAGNAVLAAYERGKLSREIVRAFFIARPSLRDLWKERHAGHKWRYRPSCPDAVLAWKRSRPGPPTWRPSRRVARRATRGRRVGAGAGSRDPPSPSDDLARRARPGRLS